MGVVTAGHSNKRGAGGVCASTVLPPAKIWRTPILSGSSVDRSIPSPAGELWEQMAAVAAVSSACLLGGGRGSGLFSLS